LYEFLGTAAWCVTVYMMVRLVAKSELSFRPKVEITLPEWPWPEMHFPAIALNVHPQPEPVVEVNENNALPNLPMEIQLFIAQESEEWMQEDLLRRAHHMYREYKNWDKVMPMLQALVTGGWEKEQEDS